MTTEAPCCVCGARVQTVKFAACCATCNPETACAELRAERDSLQREVHAAWRTAKTVIEKSAAQRSEANASKAALEKALAEALEAWDSLPGPRHYSPTDIANWVQDKLAPAFRKVRGVLSKTRGSA